MIRTWGIGPAANVLKLRPNPLVPQATGVMCALFSMPLLALLRGTTHRAHGCLSVLTAALFYAWLLVGMKCRAPVRFSFPAIYKFADDGWGDFELHATSLSALGYFIPSNAVFHLHPPYATFVFCDSPPVEPA